MPDDRPPSEDLVPEPPSTSGTPPSVSLLDLLCGPPPTPPPSGSLQAKIHELVREGRSKDEVLAALADSPPPLEPDLLQKLRDEKIQLASRLLERGGFALCRELMKARRADDPKLAEAIYLKIGNFVEAQDVVIEGVHSRDFERRVEEMWRESFQRLAKPTSEHEQTPRGPGLGLLYSLLDVPESRWRSSVSDFVSNSLQNRNPDGPGLPGEFWWKNRCCMFTGKPWEMMNVLWERLRSGRAVVPRGEVGEEIWDEEWDESKVSTTVNRLKNEFIVARVPWKVAQDGTGNIVLERSPE